jgi:hypothetical protein
MEQLDMLGEQVVPVLRKEFDALRPSHVPEAPTHASLKAARDVAHRSPDRVGQPADEDREAVGSTSGGSPS